jgi:hypothetical protein
LLDYLMYNQPTSYPLIAVRRSTTTLRIQYVFRVIASARRVVSCHGRVSVGQGAPNNTDIIIKNQLDIYCLLHRINKADHMPVNTYRKKRISLSSLCLSGVPKM